MVELRARHLRLGAAFLAAAWSGLDTRAMTRFAAVPEPVCQPPRGCVRVPTLRRP
jgi:hypothetical protein